MKEAARGSHTSAPRESEEETERRAWLARLDAPLVARSVMPHRINRDSDELWQGLWSLRKVESSISKFKWRSTLDVAQRMESKLGREYAR